MILERCLSLCGIAVIVAVAYGLSRERRAIAWRTVVIGFALQWGMALLLLKVPWGQLALGKAAKGVSTVLEQSFAGSGFMFGELGKHKGGTSGLDVVFAFQVLPTIIFIAALFSLLYYLGVMQRIVGLMAKATVRLFGASGAESLAVAASVFMGQTESPLTIRPFLARLTESELFVVMVSGMASVSGAILGAYVLIGGVEIEHLLMAVAMTAPSSLVLAKMIVPETDSPQTAGVTPDVELADRPSNLLDAVADGTTEGLKLALNVGAMLIAFLALIALCNVGLGLIEVGGEGLSLERIFGWVFFPVAVLMGVPVAEAGDVGQLLGTRTIVNEIIAFQQLHEMSELSARSSAITTFAICGFANLSSIGVQIGGLGALVPARKSDIARLGLLALTAATLANFSTACVAAAIL